MRSTTLRLICKKISAYFLIALTLNIICITYAYAFYCGPSVIKVDKKDTPFCEATDKETGKKNCKSFDVNWWDELTNTEKNNSIEDVSVEFHKKMNKLFHNQISKMISEDGNGNIKCEKKFKTDTEDLVAFAYNTKEGKVFLKEVLDSKAKYQCALFMYLKSNYLKSKDNNTDIMTLLQKSLSKEREIIQEIETTGKAVKVALESLSEMQVAYVIHKKLECTIESLNSVKETLKEFFKEVAKIPYKYINCTFQI